MKNVVEIGERREGFVPGWWCRAEVDGVAYDVGILAIPMDGPKADTWGVVRDAGGRVIWNARVPASLGARELLRLAGVVKR